MGLFANVWNRFRTSQGHAKRARRLFLEPLEGRQMLTAMLSVTKTDDHHVSGIDAGTSTPLIYTITIMNSGDQTATGVDWTDNVPDHTILNAVGDDKGSPPAGIIVNDVQTPDTGPGSTGKTIERSFDLPANTSISFTIEVSVLSNAYIQTANDNHMLHNTVNVSDTSVDFFSGSATDDTPITSQADMAIHMVAQPDPNVTAGNNITYTITVENVGPSDSPPTAALPNVFNFSETIIPTQYLTQQSFDITSYVGTGGVQLNQADWQKSGSLGSMTFTNGNAIPAGAIATFTQVVMVHSDTPGGTQVDNFAALFNQPNDNNAANDTAEVKTTVDALPAPDLVVTKNDNIANHTVIAGSDISYTITVQNIGTQPSGSVTLSDILPPNTLFGDFVADPTNTDAFVIQKLAPNASSGTVTATLASGLAAGSSIDKFTFTVHVLPTATPNTVIKNTASVPKDAAEQVTTNNSASAATTVQVNADIAVTKDDGKTSAIAGQTDTYTITVTNFGPSAVVATNEIQTLALSGNTGTFQLTFNGVTTLNTIDASSPTLGADIQAALNNLSTIQSPPGGGTGSVLVSPTGSATAFTITFGGALADQNVGQITPANASAGLTVTTDTQLEGLAPISFTDTFPADFTNVTYTSSAAGGATGNTTPGSGNINDLISLPFTPGNPSSITYTATGKIDPATQSTSLVNTATATAPTGVNIVNALGHSPTATDTDSLSSLADLQIVSAIASTPTANPATIVNPGQDLTYTIVVTNAGPSDSLNDQFTGQVPTGTTFVSFTVDAAGTAAGWTADPTQPLATNTGSFAAGATATFTLVVHVPSNPAPQNGTVLHNSFNVLSFTTPDDNNGQTNNTKTVDVTVSQPLPDIVVMKTGTASVLAGNDITYQITVTNSGQGAANNVVLLDTIPQGTTFGSFSKTSGSPNWIVSSSTVNGAAKATISQLPINGTATFQLIVHVSSSDTANILNSATATTTDSEINAQPNNNTATFTTTVNTQADVSVTKTAASNPVIVGTNETYTITVRNTGPSNAAPVVLDDSIPFNTSFVSFSAPAGWTVTKPAVGSTSGIVSASIASLAPTGNSPAVFTLVVQVGANVPSGTPINNSANVVTGTNQNGATGNDVANASVTALAQLDFGDAPDGQTLSNGVVAAYGTLLANDGARHVIVGANPLHLGATVDSELNGSPSLAANTEADDDGVTLPGAMFAGREVTVFVNSSGTGKIDAWIDFGRDGKFDATDRIATSFPVTAGANFLSFVVPANAVIGPTYARFRLSSAGGLGPTGLASDGEVEDYAVQLSAPPAPGTVGIVPNPEHPGENMLDIEGTPKIDSISLSQLRSYQLLVTVSMDGKTYGPFQMSNFRWVVIHGGAGDDRINVGIARPAVVFGEDGNDTITGGGSTNELYGGNGNDTLNGGKLDNLLVGGAGNDRLTGGGGRNVEIGGTGTDSLKGGSHDNILIGGSTVYDNSHAATDAILGLWEAPGTFLQRTNTLSAFLGPGSVIDDGARDTLTGSTSTSAPNWFIDYLMADAIVNFSAKKDRKN